MVALAGATLAGFVLGVAFERIVLRPAGRGGETGWTIATIGAVFVLLYGHALVPGWGSDAARRSPAIQRPIPSGLDTAGPSTRSDDDRCSRCGSFALLLVALAALYVFFERTYYGKAIRAAADNPLGARLSGSTCDSARAISVGLGDRAGGVRRDDHRTDHAGRRRRRASRSRSRASSRRSSAAGVAGRLRRGRLRRRRRRELLQSFGSSYDVADPIVYSLLLVMLLVRPQGLFGRARRGARLIARLRDDARMLPVVRRRSSSCSASLARGDAALAQAGTYVAIFATAAIGLSILLGNVNQISVGQAGFFGIGAYAVGYLTRDLRAGRSGRRAASGIARRALVGLALGLHRAALSRPLSGDGDARVRPDRGRRLPRRAAARRRERDHRNSVSAARAADDLGLRGVLVRLDRRVRAPRCSRCDLLRGRAGRAFEAIRNDELAAEAIGVPTRRYKILAFAYAGALAAAGGAMFAAFLGLVEPGRGRRSRCRSTCC